MCLSDEPKTNFTIDPLILEVPLGVQLLHPSVARLLCPKQCQKQVEIMRHMPCQAKVHNGDKFEVQRQQVHCQRGQVSPICLVCIRAAILTPTHPVGWIDKWVFRDKVALALAPAISTLRWLCELQPNQPGSYWSSRRPW